MNILFALPGLHRQDRGAELAFISIASELVKTNDSVTLIGSGSGQQATPYRFLRALSFRRERFERFPSLPGLRDESGYEELTFVPDFLRRYRPTDYDIVVTCGYPFTNWMLRRPVLWGRKPRHVFVTQNGDWAAQARYSEFRFFRCDGLVCTNPEFYRRNRDRWLCKLIPNGVDFDRFSPGLGEREEFGLPKDRRIVLMVSALIPTKRVEVGIAAVARVPNAHLVVAGDGPLRETIAATAAELLPGRFTRVSVAPMKMPQLYRSADAFLHLSKDEPSSLAFLEAMACGLPVVAHESPQLRWIAGDDEYLLDTDDTEAVSGQLEAALGRRSFDRERRRGKIEAFSWRSIAERYRGFFQEILTSSSGDQSKLLRAIETLRD